MATTIRASPPPPPPKPVKTNLKQHIETNPFTDHNLNNNVGNHINNNHIPNNLPPSDEQVVMTPKGKTSNSTVILIERKLVEQIGDRAHVAGGDHRGIIINKEAVQGLNNSIFL